MQRIVISRFSVLKTVFHVLLVAGVVLPDILRIVADTRCPLRRKCLFTERGVVLPARDVPALVSYYSGASQVIRRQVVRSA